MYKKLLTLRFRYRQTYDVFSGLDSSRPQTNRGIFNLKLSSLKNLSRSILVVLETMKQQMTLLQVRGSATASVTTAAPPGAAAAVTAEGTMTAVGGTGVATPRGTPAAVTAAAAIAAVATPSTNR
jgi:hypothetical protein